MPIGSGLCGTESQLMLTIGVHLHSLFDKSPIRGAALLVRDVIMGIPMDCRADACANIICAGGGSMTDGFSDALADNLGQAIAQSDSQLRHRVIKPPEAALMGYIPCCPYVAFNSLSGSGVGLYVEKCPE